MLVIKPSREEVLGSLNANKQVIEKWLPAEPDPMALRCAFSRHRTLAHLRACQEQWLSAALEFAQRDAPSITVLHPWRRFDAEDYSNVSWQEHRKAFLSDRRRWLALLRKVDWSRGGKMNRKPETIAALAHKMAVHEEHHIMALDV